MIRLGNPLKRLRHDLHSNIVSTSLNNISLSCLVPREEKKKKNSLEQSDKNDICRNAHTVCISQLVAINVTKTCIQPFLKYSRARDLIGLAATVKGFVMADFSFGSTSTDILCMTQRVYVLFPNASSTHANTRHMHMHKSLNFLYSEYKLQRCVAMDISG